MSPARRLPLARSVQKMLAVIVRPGHQDTYDVLRREFGPKGISVLWDRRTGERRQRTLPVAVERRVASRRQTVCRWNVLHFCVVQFTRLPAATPVRDPQ